jgi:hypothetical protein
LLLLPASPILGGFSPRVFSGRLGPNIYDGPWQLAANGPWLRGQKCFSPPSTSLRVWPNPFGDNFLPPEFSNWPSLGGQSGRGIQPNSRENNFKSCQKLLKIPSC